MLGSVTSPAAPLRRLVETVRDNTSLQPLDARVAAAKGEGAAPTPAGVAKAQQVAAISRPFVPLTDVLVATDNKPSYLDESMAAVARVHNVIHAHDTERQTSLLVRTNGHLFDASWQVHEVPLDAAADWLATRVAKGALVDPKVYAALFLCKVGAAQHA